MQQQPTIGAPPRMAGQPSEYTRFEIESTFAALRDGQERVAASLFQLFGLVMFWVLLTLGHSGTEIELPILGFKIESETAVQWLVALSAAASTRSVILMIYTERQVEWFLGAAKDAGYKFNAWAIWTPTVYLWLGSFMGSERPAKTIKSLGSAIVWLLLASPYIIFFGSLRLVGSEAWRIGAISCAIALLVSILALLEQGLRLLKSEATTTS